MTEDQLPATFNYDASQDFEDMDAEDILTPRVKIAQALSPEVMDGIVSSGDIFVTSTSEVIIPRGAKKTCVPLAWWKEYIEWNPDRSDKKNRIISKSTDVNGELANRCRRREKVINSDGKEVAAVQDTYNVMLLFPEISWSEMYMMSFSRTSHKVWKRMINLAKSLKHDPDGQGRRPCPLFGAGYELFTQLEEGDGNRWFEPRFGPPEFLGLEHLQAISPIVEKLRENIDHLKAINSAEAEHDTDSGSSNVDESAMGSI